ncbi:5087_t:CDS:1, partial [Racocetra persica]
LPKEENKSLTGDEHLTKLNAKNVASANPEKAIEAPPSENNSSPTSFVSSDRLAKFQERQAKSQAFSKGEIKENANQSSVIA